MQPKSVDMPPTIDLVDPKPAPSHGKRAVQITLSLIHILVACILLAMIILVLIGRNPTPFILYILPLIILIFVLEICHLRRRRLPPRITAKLGALTRLRARAFAYQAAAAYGLVFSLGGRWCYRWHGGYSCGSDDILIAVRVLAWVVWSLGVAFYALAVVSSEFGFADWVEGPEEEEERKIHLGDSDSEDGDLVGRDLSGV